jgi:hypothetical protein
MSNQQTFGYVNTWARNEYAESIEEYGQETGLMLSGNVSIKQEQADALIEYLSTADFGEYGVKLDIAIFYDPDKKVTFSGSIKSPYKKDGSSSSRTASTKARRKV